MKWSYENQSLEFNEPKVLSYGFKLLNAKYKLCKDTIENFIFLIEIQKEEKIVEIKVMDKDYELYIPFLVTTATGSLVQSLRYEAEKVLKDIKKYCFDDRNLRKEIFTYVRKKYKTIPIYPFKDTPSAAVLKNDYGKWYGILILTKAKSLGLVGEELVEIINVKLDPNHIIELLDGKTFFKAYHMNKKYWISILLHHDVDKNLIYSLIDESYNIVNK